MEISNIKRLLNLAKKESYKNIHSFLTDCVQKCKKYDPDCKGLDFRSFNDKPVIIESAGDSNEVVKLDKLYFSYPNGDYNVEPEIRISCSSAFFEDNFSLSLVDAVTMVEICEWLLDNKDDIIYKATNNI